MTDRRSTVRGRRSGRGSAVQLTCAATLFGAAAALAALAASPTSASASDVGASRADRAGRAPIAAEAATDRPPRSAARLHAWLDDGTWRSTWTPEPSVHPSSGPHGGNVRVWYSPTLVEDLAAKRRRFRKGAAMVKELHFDGVDSIQGWAVMVKVRASRGDPKRAWWYYETFDRSPGNDFAGRGLPLCANCHADGVDFLQSSYRP